MNRWIGRVLAFAVIAVLAFGAGAGANVAQAADGDKALVKSSQLDDRPWRGITLVAIGDRTVCSGFIIGPRKVVTAAHCLVRNAAGRDYRLRTDLPGSVRVYRGYSQIRGGSPYRSCKVSKVWAPARFVKANKSDTKFGSRAHDYAVLTTTSGCSFPTSAVNRMWATQAYDGKLDTGRKIRLGGYPADPRWGNMNGLNLWRSEGRVLSVGSDPRLLRFTGLVAQGMSGAPVWRSFSTDSPCGRKQCVVGIITECVVNAKGLCKKGDSPRLAVRITPTVKKALKNH